jgi:hypothetical protein
MPDRALSDQIRLEEYKSLRAEIDAKWQDQRTTERLVLFADAVIYGFIAQHPFVVTGLNKWPWFVWYIPFFAALFGCLRWWEDITDIAKAATYLREVENGCGKPAMWEHHLKSLRDASRTHQLLGRWGDPPVLIAPATALFWLALVALTFVLALLHSRLLGV